MADYYSDQPGYYGMPDMSNQGQLFQGPDGAWYDSTGNRVAEAPSGYPGDPSAPAGPGGFTDPGQGAPIAAQPDGTPIAPTPDDNTNNGGGGGAGGGGSDPNFWPTYTPPSPYQFTPFSYDSYTPLTADQAASEPGYQFARNQGREAIETSAASRGNVLSGAHLKDLFAWGDQFAGQNYQNAETRNEGVYTMNRGNAYNNWLGNQTQGLAAWQANLQPGQFGANLGQQQAGLKLNSLTNIATAGAQ